MFSKYECKIQEPWYYQIASGRKTIEGRLNKGKFKDIQVGDKLYMWFEPKNKLKKLKPYQSCEDLSEEKTDRDNYYCLYYWCEKCRNSGLDRDQHFFEAEITAIRHYDTFREMLTLEGLEKTLPGIKDINEGVKIYREFYTLEQEQEFGVMALDFKVLSSCTVDECWGESPYE